jgi:hypothetical protein
VTKKSILRTYSVSNPGPPIEVNDLSAGAHLTVRFFSDECPLSRRMKARVETPAMEADAA